MSVYTDWNDALFIDETGMSGSVAAFGTQRFILRLQESTLYNIELASAFSGPFLVFSIGSLVKEPGSEVGLLELEFGFPIQLTAAFGYAIELRNVGFVARDYEFSFTDLTPDLPPVDPNLADLIVSFSDVTTDTLVDGEDITFDIRVANLGGAATGAFVVELFAFPSDAQDLGAESILIEDFQFEGLGAGEEVTSTQTLTVDLDALGPINTETVLFSLVLDREETLQEQSVANNLDLLGMNISREPSNAPTNGDDVIVGTAAADTILGLAGDDSIVGNGGPDSLNGGLGQDTLLGGGGSDTLVGGNDADLLLGGTANDRLIGGRGNDVMRGGNGDDTLLGAEDNDSLLGEVGRDLLRGALGNDTLNGGVGIDTLVGGNGRDLLIGGGSGDRLVGGGGLDTIQGGAGNDLLTGGSLRDVVVYANGFGQDTITDFQDGIDRIKMAAVTGVNGFGDLTVQNVAGGVRIFETGTPAHWIKLNGLTKADIDAGDFLF